MASAAIQNTQKPRYSQRLSSFPVTHSNRGNLLDVGTLKCFVHFKDVQIVNKFTYQQKDVQEEGSCHCFSFCCREP